MWDLYKEVSRLLDGLNGPDPLPMVDGMTSRKVRLLLNRICQLRKGWSHLEVGSYKGATLTGALYGNHDARGVAFEDYSEYQTQTQLRENLTTHAKEMGAYTLVERDVFAARDAIPASALPFDSFFYDGNHSENAQQQAVELAFEICAAEFVFLVDDWNWDNVRRGTWSGLSSVRAKTLRFWELPARWNWDAEQFHNGIGLFVIER